MTEELAFSLVQSKFLLSMGIVLVVSSVHMPFLPEAVQFRLGCFL